MRRFFLLFFIFFLLYPGTLWAKNSPPFKPLFSDKDLRKIIAPIALYPDPLLAQMLPASAYAVEIVQAARAIQNDQDLATIDSKPWATSVKALAHYPEILKMMDQRLEWTDLLGQAVTSQPEDVLRTIQDLRHQAYDSGALKSDKKQKVLLLSDHYIEIIPTRPDRLYIPNYDWETVYDSSPVEPTSPPISYGQYYPPGGWLDTAFNWPGSAIEYGGPYYYGWNYPGSPFWSQYPRGWDDWGWNRWRPRRNWPSSVPVHRPYPIPSQPMAVNPNRPLVPQPGSGAKLTPPGATRLSPPPPRVSPPAPSPSKPMTPSPAPTYTPKPSSPSGGLGSSSPAPANNSSKITPKTISSPPPPAKTLNPAPSNPSPINQKKNY